jgi:hypothetical protein
LERKLAGTEVMLKEKTEDLERHRTFSDFLQKVVNPPDKSADNEGFSEIQELQNRFISLKEENK